MGRLKLKPTRARLSKKKAVSGIGGSPKPIMKDKGKYNGHCNITACQRPNSARWYNHGTQKYYCEPCAHILNNDEFNRKWAAEHYGHPLCTKGKTDDPSA